MKKPEKKNFKCKAGYRCDGDMCCDGETDRVEGYNHAIDDYEKWLKETLAKRRMI